MEISRRAFVRTVAAAGVASVMDAPIQAAQRMAREPARGARALAKRFPDLPRHFAFEYYPWYAASPYPHWDQDGRHPPVDLASNYMARLGAYDSRSTVVMEQHARWIVESGAGAINVSWWGRDSDVDRIVHGVTVSALDFADAATWRPHTDRVSGWSVITRRSTASAPGERSVRRQPARRRDRSSSRHRRRAA